MKAYHLTYNSAVITRQPRLAVVWLWLAALSSACSQFVVGGQSAVVLARVPHGGVQPEVAVDQEGLLHMVYFSGQPGGGNLFYVRSADSGATFSAPIRVNSQDGSAIALGTIRGAQLAVGRNGRVHVSWNGSSTAEPKAPANPPTKRSETPMLYARANNDGAAFEPQRNVITQTTNLDGGGSIAADANGHVYVAWHGNGAGEAQGEGDRHVWLVHSTDDGATFEAERPVWREATGACGCCGMRLSASALGTLHLLYRSATHLTNRDLYVLRSDDRGGTFHGRLVHPWSIGACPMTSMSTAATQGRTYGAWETDGQVLFADLDSPDTQPIVAPGNPGGRKHPRLAVNHNGQTLLVWTEGMAWARGGSVAWQVFDAQRTPTSINGTQAGVPVWSFAAVVARRDGRFIVFY